MIILTDKQWEIAKQLLDPITVVNIERSQEKNLEKLITRYKKEEL